MRKIIQEKLYFVFGILTEYWVLQSGVMTANPLIRVFV